MHFAQAIERASIHAVRLHGWMWPLIITLAYTFAASPGLPARLFFSLSPVSVLDKKKSTSSRNRSALLREPEYATPFRPFCRLNHSSMSRGGKREDNDAGLTIV